jgi:hypothetical protein
VGLELDEDIGLFFDNALLLDHHDIVKLVANDLDQEVHENDEHDEGGKDKEEPN